MTIPKIVTDQARTPQTRVLQPSVTVDAESVTTFTALQTEQVTRRQFTRPRESMMIAFEVDDIGDGCKGCGQ